MPRSIIVSGSPEQQRPDERVAYQVTLDASYASPGTPVAALWDITDADNPTNVSGAQLVGSPAIVGQSYTSPLVISIAANHKYRLEFQFVSGGNTFEPYLIINGKA